MKSIALLILVTCTSALRRHRLETTAATLRGGEGRWRKVKGGASSLRSSARAWADYLTGANVTTNITTWTRPKKKLKKPSVGPEDQYEVAEAFAEAARAVTRPSLRVIATTVVPACGAVLANGMFLASWPAVAQARTSKQLGALNPLPFAFTFANCVGWLHYGFVCRNHYVFWSNALGCVLGLLYTTTALKLGCPDVVERVAVGGLVIHIGAAYVTGLRLASPAKRKLCAGLVANFILLCYYAAPLSTVAAVVVRSRDASSISGPLVLVNAGNGLLWTVYGAAVEDALVWAPNLAGVALAAAQLALKLAFRGARASTTAVAATAAKGVT
ncbi:unnamed protein product [Pelagomonas calceolata]|uniref:Bidirectional sugar transporter SWEET n=1 Tax=Pelagomonas calceolata TaxID=35677 RepID=A0A8J2SBU7_9STRA|nr:unnamed protein product [Pelagomonas calceolata]